VKLTAISLLTGSLQGSARTTAQQRISITIKGATLEKVFAEIEKRSGYAKLYNAEPSPFGTFLVKMDAPDAAIEELLNAQQYLTMLREAPENDGKSQTFPSDPINGIWDTTRYTNWQIKDGSQGRPIHECQG
jgi:hypothetical protein